MDDQQFRPDVKNTMTNDEKKKERAGADPAADQHPLISPGLNSMRCGQHVTLHISS